MDSVPEVTAVSALTDIDSQNLVYKPLCLACGVEGREVYKDCLDFFCGSSGTYTYLQCHQCNLLWISPQPEPLELNSMYEEFYDDVQSTATVTDPSGSTKDRFRNAILRRRLGYFPGTSSRNSVIDLLAFLTSWVPFVYDRTTFGLGMTFPAYQPEGKLLEIGAGHGWYLKIMKNLGWDVTGVEWNPISARKASTLFDIEVFPGAVEEANFEDNSFDAITLRHVIEHVPDPIETLRECKRILKPGGKIHIATPNGASLASKWFRRHWRGLTAPWHLHLFSKRSIELALQDVGFQSVKAVTRSFPAGWIFTSSQRIREGRFSPSEIVRPTYWFHGLESVGNLFLGHLGEELEAVARKKS
jgi:2-polyprenyl-3-methyl-5-hydroxy-6-metoxy-1,4-benzoquinol methylase